MLFLGKAILFSFCLMLNACSQELRTKPLEVEALKPYQACREDRDCIIVRNGSCDICNGGGSAAIAESQRLEFRKLFKSIPCLKRMCGHRTHAKCQNGFCAEIANKEPDSKGVLENFNEKGTK